jgi:hypothetical protein
MYYIQNVWFMDMKRYLLFQWMTLILSCITLVGCSANGQRTLGKGQAPMAGRISKEELRDHLNGFGDAFKASLDVLAEEIKQRASSKSIQMQLLQMRSRTVYGLNAMLQEEDAIVAFLDTWALCIRFRIFLEEGEGSRLFGEDQILAIDAAKSIEGRIEEIGRLFLSDELYQTTRRDLEEIGRANPIKSNYSNIIQYATKMQKNGQQPLLSIVAIPMEPFRAIGGVDRTASAISRFTDTANRFSDILTELPESSRWQLLMFLYELEETEMAKSLVSSTAKLSDSSERLAQSSEQLPQQIRKELSTLLDEIDGKQANLQTTLTQAQKTVEGVQVAVDKVKDASVALDQTAQAITETADAWKEAAQATGEVVKEAEKFRPAEGSPPSTFNIKDYQQTAQSITEAAKELRAATAEMRALADLKWVSNITGILVWRIAEVMGILLGGLLMYRILVNKRAKA